MSWVTDSDIESLQRLLPWSADPAPPRSGMTTRGRPKLDAAEFGLMVNHGHPCSSCKVAVGCRHECRAFRRFLSSKVVVRPRHAEAVGH